MIPYTVIRAIDLGEVPDTLHPVSVVSQDGSTETITGLAVFTPLSDDDLAMINFMQGPIHPLTGYEPYLWEWHLQGVTEDGQPFLKMYAVRLESDEAQS